MKIIVSFVFVIVFLTTAVISVHGQGEFKEYKGKFVEFQYPVEWESAMTEGLEIEGGVYTKGIHIPPDNRISFDIPNTKGEGGFTILIEDSDKKNLDELLQKEIQSYQEGESITGYKEEVLEITDVILSNEPAKKIIVYQEEYDNKLLQIFSLHDNKRYLITYRMPPASFEDHIPTIEKMIQSVKFPITQ